MKRFTPFILAAGDALALLLFVAIGQRDHEMVNPENPIGGPLLTAGEFVLPWLVVGWLVGAFATAARASGEHGASGAVSGRVVVLRALNAWLIAAPLAILLRAAVLDRAIIPTIFMVVAMTLGGAFVMAWRLLFVLAVWLLQRRTPEAKTLQRPT
jgi:hypothetical protein